jgi:predicted nucleotidyltransferase component of viral defense system
VRHGPAQSPQGRDAGVIDIAQDLLLRHLSERGIPTLVAFKGGTALRKVYAGAGGRFSTDLDFSVATLDDDPATVIRLFVDEINGTRLGPFTCSIDDRRGRYAIIYQSELGPDLGGPLLSKIDVGPPTWLEPAWRSWVEAPIHIRYGGPLPVLPVVDLAEYMGHYNAHRPHRSLDQRCPTLVKETNAPIANPDPACIRRTDVLGGLIHEYRLVA